MEKHEFRELYTDLIDYLEDNGSIIITTENLTDDLEEIFEICEKEVKK